MEWYSDWRVWAIAVASILLLYLARKYIHDVLKSVFFGIGHWLKMISVWLRQSAERIYDRYAVSVAAHRAEEFEQRLERHQRRITQRAEVDTGRMEQALTNLEVGAIALDGAAKNLSDVNLSREAEHGIRDALRAERDLAPGAGASAGRTIQAVKTTLAGKVAELRPDIIQVRKTLPALQQSTAVLRETEAGLTRAAKQIDKDFMAFDEAVTSDNRRAVAARESIVIPFFLSLLVMGIALFGVFLNFFLIQRPMAEIVGDDARVAGLDLPTVAAIVVIFLEAAAGIVLMDSLRITRLTKIPELGDGLRRVFLVASVIVLALFSLFEAFLAFQRELLIELDQATLQMAQGGVAAVEGKTQQGMSFALWAQVILAVVIPWLLATVAIPLEAVVRNLWFIVQLVAHQVLMFLSILAKTLGTLVRSVGLFLLRLYDLVIFLPLAVEDMVRSFRKDQPETPAAKKADLALVTDRDAPRQRQAEGGGAWHL